MGIQGRRERYERAHIREAVELLPDHHRGIFVHHPGGHRPADAARLVPFGQMDLPGGRPVHRHLRRVRDGPGGPGHGHLLVLLRAGGDPGADPDGRPGHRHRHGPHRHGLRAKGHAAAAQHAPGEHLGVSAGRHPEADPVHLPGGPGDGADGRPADAPHVPLPLRPARHMDGPVPFRLRLLQRGLRPYGRPPIPVPSPP